MSAPIASAPPTLPEIIEAPSVWRTVESTMGAFFAFVVGFVVIVLGGNFVYLAHGSPEFPIVLGAFAVVGPAELWGLIRLKHALERGVRPLAPGLALSQPRWPLLLRPLVAAWWLAHYAVGLAAVVMLERYFPVSADDWRLTLFLWTVYAGCLFTTTHSAHLYLLLAVGSITRRAGPVMWLWRWRWVIDVVIALAAFWSKRFID